jgi:hypothetical protein
MRNWACTTVLRGCLPTVMGDRSLAYAELYLDLATIVLRFDWEMYETKLDDIVCKHNYFVAVADRDSKGVRARMALRDRRLP